MRPGESFVGQPIRSLQTMLRVLAENDERYLPLIPDGIYGPETTRAVTNFQRQHGIPVTGITDQITWDAVVAAFEPALVEQYRAGTADYICEKYNWDSVVAQTLALYRGEEGEPHD